MPGWAIAATVAAVAALISFIALFRHVWRMVQRTKARRPDLTRAEFIAALSREVRPDTAEFLWDRMLFLLPTIAPHPDDHLWNDLPIDQSEPMIEWLCAFAERRGMAASDWPAWPAGSPCTIRNYARWLERGATRTR